MLHLRVGISPPDQRRPAQRAADAVAAYVFAARYAHRRPASGRLETFAEAIARVRDMHRRFFRERLGRAFSVKLPPAVARLAGADAPVLAGLFAGRTLGGVIEAAFAAAAERRVLPSLRSLQFGGGMILRNHARLFNCAFANVDRLEFFRGYLFLLLCGCGVGFSVQRHHVARLPLLPVNVRGPARRHRIIGTPRGWGDALHALVSAAFAGRRITFFGGAGQPALRSAFRRVRAVLRGAAGRRLRPVEVYDIATLVAAAARAPGGRRAATICLFSPDDDEMLAAKSGAWLKTHPERAASNNSAVIPRHRRAGARFNRVIAASRVFGEPGVFFCDHRDAGCNPCGEVCLVPVIDWRPSAAERAILGEGGNGRGRRSGFQLCNLTTINGAAARTADEFLSACVAATVIGTLQAAYTRIPYLGPVTRVLNEHEALLGVSICGFMDNPALLLSPRLLRRGARLCRATNRLVARVIGIRPAARITTCKPEGTASLLLGTAPGIHPYPARRFLRRIVVDRRESAYACFRTANPHLTAPSAYHPESDDVITFASEARPGALVRSDLSALDFLRVVLLVRRNWVVPGTDPAARSPGLHHNVSHTCTVRPGEWEAVRAFLWRHRRSFSGVALLPVAGDRTYPQAPFEAVRSSSQLARWRRLVPRPMDYSRTRVGTASRVRDDGCDAGDCDLPGA